MPVLDPTDLSADAIVTRRIRRDWRDDIVVVDAGRSEDVDWVDIACSSTIACEQARISLAAFVRNPSSDWHSGWTEVDDGALPFRLRVEDPRLEGYDELAAA